MTPESAHNVVLGCGLTVAGVAVIDAARTASMPSARRILGAGIGTVALSALAGPAPDMAAGLALLWAVSTLLLAGAPALAAMAGAVAAHPATKTMPATPVTPSTPVPATPDARPAIPGRPGTW